MTTSSPSEQIRQVAAVVAAVPPGSVATYGQVARLCGMPRHARYIGYVLKHLPGDTKLPWHRIVNARGTLSFPCGSGKWREQQRKLEEEGVQFNSGRISLSRYQWHP